MEYFWIFLIAFLFTLCGLAGAVLTLVGLPGAWMIIGMALIIELTDGLWLSSEDPNTFGWTLIIVAVALGLLGEILELFAGMLGARRGGSNRRGAIGALVGGIVGAIVGTPFVPPFGPMIGAVIGTFAGAIVGELSAEQATLRGSLKPATGATIGRILGTLSKLPIVFAIWFVLAVAAWWP